MHKYLLKFVAVISIFTMVSCEEDYGTFLSDNLPDYPIIFSNATTYGYNPFIEVPIGNGAIEFVLTLPEGSDASIAEISMVAGGGTGINAGNLTEENNYISSPIPASGGQVTFATSIQEFEQLTGASEPVAIDDELAFIFMVELDNGEEIITTQVRAIIVE